VQPGRRGRAAGIRPGADTLFDCRACFFHDIFRHVHCLTHELGELVRGYGLNVEAAPRRLGNEIGILSICVNPRRNEAVKAGGDPGGATKAWPMSVALVSSS